MSPLALFALLASAAKACQNNYPDDQTYQVGDGTADGENRCFTVITPDSAPRPMPVVFWYHGFTGNANNCGNGQDAEGRSLRDHARAYGFALVCAEAVQGNWRIPPKQTDDTGTLCGTEDSPEPAYLRNILAKLDTLGGAYDTSSIFNMGCSQGSAFSSYISQCMKADSNISPALKAFATHSTGLKVKGDGLPFPQGEAECDGCQYFPFVPNTFYDDLKGCFADNFADPHARRRNLSEEGEEAARGPHFPLFYYSTQHLNQRWTGLGMNSETFFAGGGHCYIHSYGELLACLDNRKGKLLGGSVGAAQNRIRDAPLVAEAAEQQRILRNKSQ